MINPEDKTLQALATSLNFRKLRQDVIASNIANADTPGYKARRIEFEEALARALDLEKQRSLRVNNQKHYNVGGGGFDEVEPTVFDDPNGIVNESGNTVNRDQEMASMAKNKILFDASVQLLNKKLGLLKYAITSDR